MSVSAHDLEDLCDVLGHKYSVRQLATALDNLTTLTCEELRAVQRHCRTRVPSLPNLPSNALKDNLVRLSRQALDAFVAAGAPQPARPVGGSTSTAAMRPALPAFAPSLLSNLSQPVGFVPPAAAPGAYNPFLPRTSVPPATQPVSSSTLSSRWSSSQVTHGNAAGRSLSHASAPGPTPSSVSTRTPVPAVRPVASSYTAASQSASHFRALVAVPVRAPVAAVASVSAPTGYGPNALSVLLQHPAFQQNRSPFYTVDRQLGSALFVQGTRKAQIVFTRTPSLRGQCQGPAPSHAIHLRLFGDPLHDPRHVQFDQTGRFQLYVNQTFRQPTIKLIKKGGTKKAGLEVVPPLDITPFVIGEHADAIQVEILLQATTPPSTFLGMCVIELVRVQSASTIATALIVAAQSAVSEPMAATAVAVPAAASSVQPATLKTEVSAVTLSSVVVPPVKRCNVCSSTNNLQRCSRCKAVWYCGATHQGTDWPSHRLVCQVHSASSPPPPPPPPPFPAPSVAAGKAASVIVADEFEVEEMDAFISLACPLSIIRIRTPAKGAQCRHAQCFDLEVCFSCSFGFLLSLSSTRFQMVVDA
jgi:hypothetical protein